MAELARWVDFEAAAPELAAAGRGLLYQHGIGLGYLATIRPNGGPRIHPFCPILAAGGLSQRALCPDHFQSTATMWSMRSRSTTMAEAGRYFALTDDSSAACVSLAEAMAFS